jgi:hypothetical protein
LQRTASQAISICTQFPIGFGDAVESARGHSDQDQIQARSTVIRTQRTTFFEGGSNRSVIDTHRQINALLTDHPLVLMEQMQARMREEGRERYIDSLRNR